MVGLLPDTSDSLGINVALPCLDEGFAGATTIWVRRSHLSLKTTQP